MWVKDLSLFRCIDNLFFELYNPFLNSYHDLIAQATAMTSIYKLSLKLQTNNKLKSELYCNVKIIY